jgi:phosphoenolpyruvate carboxykinase (ATP)
LEDLGIRAATVHWNPGTAMLVERAIQNREGMLAGRGALVVRTGQFTGRSPRDKFIVREPATETTVAWGSVNQPMTPEHFEGIWSRLLTHLEDKEILVEDLIAGADRIHKMPIRVVVQRAWHALFARQLFIRPREAQLADHKPEFTLVFAPDFQCDPERDGTRSETCIVINFERRLVLIVGTSYAGEMKKSVFTLLNYLLPPKNILPMHCSANVGDHMRVALFFGLSGTGKTTLSADRHRRLVGDDEHGWCDRGVFNFEGGCYAKVIDLSQQAEPEIWAAIHHFGAVLENVVADEHGRLDLTDTRYTENTRACYPAQFIPNAVLPGRGGQPRNVVMLTADAFGVLPPIARLTPAQAMYHFLSGYTAKVAGTEKGLGAEPEATFSTCFGAPFLPRRPEVYGRMLADLIARNHVDCWLVNTGWSGGPYGVGSRMSIRHTRALVRAALDGSLARVEFRREPFFGLMIPANVPGVPTEVLDPRQSWSDKAAYDATARDLVSRFEANFTTFADHVGDDVRAVALKAR